MRKILGPSPSGPTDEVPKSYVDTADNVRARFQGIWSGTSGYAVNDVVSDGGNAYVCTSPVVAPAATSYIDKTTGSSVNNGTVNVALPSTVRSGDMAIIATDTDSGTYSTVPVTGATRLGTVIPGNNAAFGFLHYYTVSATDVANGYLVVSGVNTTSTLWVTCIQFYRNVTTAPNVGSNSSGWYTTTLLSSTTTTPTSYSDFIPTFSGSALTALTNTITNSSLTDMTYTAAQASPGTRMIGLGGGTRTVASGTQPATTFVYSARSTAGAGHTMECFVPISTGAANADPSLDPTHWTLLAGEAAGTIKMYGGSAAPSGYLACTGMAVSRSDYPALFAAIGTAYGVGDGSTTFNLPDFWQRFPTGYGIGVQGGDSIHAHTDTLAAPQHTHSTPNHAHNLSDAGRAGVWSGSSITYMRRVGTGFSYNASFPVGAGSLPSGNSSGSVGLDGATDSGGAGTTTGASATALSGSIDPVEVYPPFLGVMFIIKI